MAKKIPGNSDYTIDLDGIIYNHSGKVVSFPTVDDKIEIELYGRLTKIGRRQLSLLAWYECEHIRDLDTHLDKINFLPADPVYLKVRCGMIMSFSEPIVYKTGFRYIPNHPRYAVSCKGVVVDTTDDTVVSRSAITPTGYYDASVYCPDRNKKRLIKLHRLVAFAWIPNDDFIKRPLVNHIDGVKTNNVSLNLEWCSSADNNRHAWETGLNDTCREVKVRDVKTGKITVYKSIAELRRVGIGIGSTTDGITKKLPGYLWKRRYEVKFIDDETPWFYEKVDPDDFSRSKTFFLISVFDKTTGKVRKFNDFRRVARVYGLRYETGKVDKLVLAFNSKYSNLEMSYERLNVHGPYYIYDDRERTLIIVESLEQISKVIGRTKSELQFDLSRGRKFIYDKRWFVSMRGEALNRDDYSHKPAASTEVLVKNVFTGDELTASSIKSAARITGLNEKTVKHNLNRNRVTKGFIFGALDQ